MSLSMQQLVQHVADRYLKWNRPVGGGTDLQGACPFHAESSEGAFYISLETGLFICHGCLAKGSLTTFLRLVGSPSNLRREAQEELAKRSPRSRQSNRYRQRVNVTILDESLLGIFDRCPLDLVDAGFSPKLLKSHQIGFDLDAMRITFPLRDVDGNLVGISGRTVIDEKPRYLIYTRDNFRRLSDKPYHDYTIDKRALLWNYHNVFPGLYHGLYDEVLIVEGYKACLWAIQCGVPETVALMGVSLSEAQLQLLQRTRAKIKILLDNTTHAQTAAGKAARRLARSHRVYVCQYPPELEAGAQPDDLTADELTTAVRQAVPYLKWRRTHEQSRNIRQTLSS